MSEQSLRGHTARFKNFTKKERKFWRKQHSADAWKPAWCPVSHSNTFIHVSVGPEPQSTCVWIRENSASLKHNRCFMQGWCISAQPTMYADFCVQQGAQRPG